MLDSKTENAQRAKKSTRTHCGFTETATTRSGVMKIPQRVVIVKEDQILQKNNQPLTSKQLH
jgi:hypothetical protein